MKKIAIALVLAMAILGIGLFVLGQHGNTNGSQTITQKSNQAQNQSTTNSTTILFARTQYAQYSYQIFPGPMSQQARQAMAGFNLTTSSLKNGTTDVNIAFMASGQSQSISLKPGYKVYIIETSFGDDGFGSESSLSDDGFTVVDPNGYIMQ